MIKNIIFDIDGVLVDSNLTYTEFLKHTYDKYKDIEYDNLPYLFPISLDDGAIKLTADLSADFKKSEWYSYRPLFPDTMKVLKTLKKSGYRMFTLSAARNPEKKLEWASKIFIKIFDSFEFSPANQPKENALLEMLKKHSLNKEETLFVDDRFQNVRAGLSAGLLTIRMRPKISLPLPADLNNVKQVNSMTELAEFLNNR